MCSSNVRTYEYARCKGGYCVLVLDMEYLNSELSPADSSDSSSESCLFFKPSSQLFFAFAYRSWITILSVDLFLDAFLFRLLFVVDLDLIHNFMKITNSKIEIVGPKV